MPSKAVVTALPSFVSNEFNPSLIFTYPAIHRGKIVEQTHDVIRAILWDHEIMALECSPGLFFHALDINNDSWQVMSAERWIVRQEQDPHHQEDFPERDVDAVFEKPNWSSAESKGFALCYLRDHHFTSIFGQHEKAATVRIWRSIWPEWLPRDLRGGLNVKIHNAKWNSEGLE